MEYQKILAFIIAGGNTGKNKVTPFFSLFKDYGSYFGINSILGM